MILDLFAGPGGWSTGLNMLDRAEDVGLEWDDAACLTGLAAGHKREMADVATVDLARFRDVEGVIASPPCQGFSRAGLGKGRDDTDTILAAVAAIGAGNKVPYVLDRLRERCADSRSALVLEPLRYVLQLLPEWVAWEQVPSVLPLWEACTGVLNDHGYHFDVDLVNAETVGVPQTRRRAILVAHRSRPVSCVTATHSKFYSRDPQRLDVGVQPWVSMAEALGWGLDERVGFPRLAETPSNYAREVVEIDGGLYRGRDLVSTAHPSHTVTEKARSWKRWEFVQSRQANATVRDQSEPAPTIHSQRTSNMHWRQAVAAEVAPRVNNQSGTEFDLSWPAERPSPVVAGRNIITMPGANANRHNGRTKSRNDGIRVTVPEAGVLQSFPADYPWQGTSTAQFRQVGDAIPPLLASAILKELL